MNAQCEYHAGIPGHSIENCTAFKKAVERFIKMGIVKFDNPSGPNVAGNPLPNLSDNRVNAIIENGGRRIKDDIADVNTPLKWVWRQMIKGGLIKQESKEGPEGVKKYCEFHAKEDHDIQNCTEFRAMVQNLMNNKELEFYEEINGLEEGEVFTLEEGLTGKAQNHPMVIISRPRNIGSGIQLAPWVIIQKPVPFPYNDSKKVPWSYDYNVTIPENLINVSEEGNDVGFYTRSGKHYDPANTKGEPIKGKALAVEQDKTKTARIESLVNKPVTENEAREFLKFLKHSEYSVVEQLHKLPARISVLELLLSLETHLNKLDRLVNNINADNFIFFNDDEIPPGGMGSTKALHITARCKGCILPGVLIDNGSALNVLPLSTLNRLHVDRAVPSSLHQKLKLVTEGRLVTIGAEEDIIASVTDDMPYIEADSETIECSFRSLEFVNATFVVEGSKIPEPKISKATLMSLQLTMERGALPGRGLGKYLQGRVEVPILVNEQDRCGLGYKPDARERKKELEKKREKRRAHLSGIEIEWGPMTFLHISKTFVSGGFVYPEEKNEVTEGRTGRLDINTIFAEERVERNLSGIRPYELGSVLNNWTAEEIPVTFRTNSESSDINETSDTVTNSEFLFERDMSVDDPQDFEDDQDSVLSPNLLRMVEEEKKQILPYEESVEVVILEEGRSVKIGAGITEETRQDLVELLQEFKDVFAWSYQDMPGLSTDIMVHRLPIKEECRPIQQKLRRMRPDVLLKIKEEVKKQFDTGFLQVVKYSEWVANIVHIPKKDGKVRMCVDYRDLNKASPKDNFPLPHIDTLVDNTAGYSLFSFMDGFS
ncbi:uncharacterized protein LOC105779109 [Gossypium raimondii]|uniref:uncharacterized protein LOC105779109 n=1 Tax=Gossypium raimondii TaxID=29730 RepID=UPI00227A8951|nr:uncharacterized protein LOC105779109 [Gossypium raimondii]